jgi:hypothetical protein
MCVKLLEGMGKYGGGNVTVTSTKIINKDVAKNATDFLRLVLQISTTDSVSVCENSR